MKVSFKVKKTGKASKYSYTSKVNVIEDKQNIVSAEATGVKTITLTMAKDVASVASPVAITVKKGTSDRACTPAADGKTITLAMDAKLVAGEYTVTIKGLESEDLTATVSVAKNETLTSFEIADNIVPNYIGVTEYATVKYKALNQYNEMMLAGTPTVSSSFGEAKVTRAASATKEGIIEISKINAVLAIKGTKGTVTVVDQSGTGVNATKEVTMSDMASAADVQFVDAYNVQKGKIQGIKANDKVADYELLFTVKDQYGSELNADDLIDTQVQVDSTGTKQNLTGVNVTVIGQIVNVAGPANTTKAFTDRTVDGKDYVAIKLQPASANAYAHEGQFTVNMTNAYKGSLLNQTVDVSKDVIIKSVNFTFENGVYANETENEIGFEILDDEGNSVKDYASLKNAMSTNVSPTGAVSLVRNADGSAKFLLDGTKFNSLTTSGKNDTMTVPQNFTTQWNRPEGGQFLVQTTQFTLNQNRYPKTVSKLKDGTKKTLSSKGVNELSIDVDKFLIADQFGAEMDYTHTLLKNNKIVSYGAIDVRGISVFVEDGGVVTAGGVVAGGVASYASGSALMFKTLGNGKAGSATVYVKFCSAAGNLDPRDDDKGKVTARATKTDYDYKFTVDVLDTFEVVENDYSLTINDGNVVRGIYDASAVANAKMLYTELSDGNKDLVASVGGIEAAVKLEVTTKVGGQTVVVPSSQYRIVKNEGNEIKLGDYKKGTKTGTGKLTVSVTTKDSVGNSVEKLVTAEYTYSNDTPYLYKMDGNVVNDVYTYDTNLSSSNTNPGIVTRSALLGYFKYKDQYGVAVTSNAAITALNAGSSATINVNDVVFHITKKSGANNGPTIYFNDMKEAQIDATGADAGDYAYTITATAKNGSTASMILKVTVTP